MSGFAHDLIVAWRALGVVLLQGTVLALIAWALAQTLLRRARPALVAALWSIVLVKFALPVGPAMPFSLSDGLARLFAHAPADAAAPQLEPIGGAAHAAAPGLTLAGVLAIAGALLWLAGVIVVIARGVRHQRRARAAARALPAADGVTDAIACGIAVELGLGRTPELRVGGDAPAPWLVGLRRPIVVVPAALTGAARRAELTAALTHELAHLRRRDVWLRLLQVAVGALFFFFPVVRWVNRRIDAAREMACDAWAIACGPLPAPDYARMLVRLVREHAAPAGALAFAATPGLLRGRVESAMSSHGAGPGLGKLGAIGLGAWTLVALGGARAARGEAAPAKVCHYSQAMADALYASHPEADLDGDGTLTRDEACGFELGRRAAIVAAEPGLADFVPEGSLDPEHLCCNCTEHGSTPPVAHEPVNTCVRGVTP